MLIGSFSPPTDLVAHHGAEAFFTALMAAIIAAAFVWAVVRREPLLIVLSVTAAISSLIEPMYDYLGDVWWADNLTSAFSMFDGRIYNPTIFPLGYAMWIGLGTYTAFRLLDRQPSRKAILRAFVLLAPCEAALELPWIFTDMLRYYPPQPFRAFGYSLVWDAINTSALAINGALLLALRDGGWLEGKRVMVACALPFTIIGWYFAAGWPVWTTLHAEAPELVMWIVGTLVIVVCAVAIMLVATWVARRDRALHGATRADASLPAITGTSPHVREVPVTALTSAP
jgi:hypothetical protein